MIIIWLKKKHIPREKLLGECPTNLTAIKKTYKEYKIPLQHMLRRLKYEWWLKISEDIQNVYNAKDLLNQV